MRSRPLAIGWEMLHRGTPWGVILAALLANAMPVFLFALLRHEETLDLAGPTGLLMHFLVLLLNWLFFGLMVVAMLSPMSRLYTYPVANSTLVGWHMLLGMGAVTLEMAAFIGLMNAIFALDWQPLGPALFAGAAFAAFQASFWLTEKSGWLLAALGAAVIPLCLWFKSRYGPLLGQPSHYWTEVTLGDAAALAAVSIGAYFVGVYGVSRNRCGSPPYSIGLIAWLRRVFAFGPQTQLAWRDPLQAQLWYEWRTKGVVIPATVGIGEFIGVGIWLLKPQDANYLFAGFIVGGALVAVSGALGFLHGIVGRLDGDFQGDFQISQFLATRPLTNTQLAGTILRTMAKSVFLGWAIWALSLLIVYAVVLALRVNLGVEFPAPLGWWSVPVALLGAWTLGGVMVAVALTGRQYVVAGFLVVAAGLPIGLLFFAQVALSPRAQDYLALGLAAFCGVAFVVGTIAALVAARRRALVTGPMLSAAAVAWGALCVLAALIWLPSSVERLAVYICITGILALSVAPLATAPLALAWNRTR
jgi:hypothetical protein